jgi:hypothetical protein
MAAYKYFSQQLLTSNLDLSIVLPKAQEAAKEKQNISYGLGDVVLYLQDATENFKFFDQKYVDLDNGIREIINKYYVSTDQANPFDQPEADKFSEYKKGVVPREAAVLEEDGIKGKGIKSPKGSAEEDVLLQKIDRFKSELENRQMLIDDADADEKQELLDIFRKRLVGTELLIEDGDADAYDKARYEMLKDFIQKNS